MHILLPNARKHSGSFFGAFSDVSPDSFHVTRGDPGCFQSSDEAMRGFCRDCGTPLFYKFLSRPRIAVAIGSLDRHSEVMPEAQYRIEAREPWFADLPHLPQTATGEGDNDVSDTPARLQSIRLSNRQHPDHDTVTWPSQPAESGRNTGPT